MDNTTEPYDDGLCRTDVDVPRYAKDQQHRDSNPDCVCPDCGAFAATSQQTNKAMNNQRIRIYLGHDIKGERTVSPNNISGFLQTVSNSFPGFTSYDATGYWEGDAETCTVVEIVSDAELALPMVRSLCKSYARMFEQTSVMITSEPLPVVEFQGAE